MCTISPSPPESFCARTAQLHTGHYVTLRRLLRKVHCPVSGSLRKLQTAVTSLHELEVGPNFESVAPECPSAGFDFVALNVEHTIKTKIVALRQLLQWSGYPAVVLLQEVGVPPTSKEYCPLLQWPRAHVAPGSQMVLLGVQCIPRCSTDCVYVHTEIAPVLLEFVADMHLHHFVHGM